MEANTNSNQYVFNFDWETVIKAYWNKYPHKDLDFVVYNRVIDIKRLDDDSLVVKKLMFCKKFKLIWAYTMEEMRIDVNQRILDLQTQILAATKGFPTEGVERICYQAVNNEKGKTLYTKFLESRSTLQKYYGKINSGFEKGCKIVEEKCKEVLNSDNKD